MRKTEIRVKTKYSHMHVKTSGNENRQKQLNVRQLNDAKLQLRTIFAPNADKEFAIRKTIKSSFLLFYCVVFENL